MKLYRQEFINGELFLRHGNNILEENSSYMPYMTSTDVCSNLYQIAANEDGVFFRTRNNDGELSKFRKTSYKKIEKELIPLMSYLLNAEYLGLPASINCVDLDQNKKIINGVILYKTPKFLIVYDMEPNNLSGKILPVKIIDGHSLISYVVTGTETNIYSDPKELYHDLFVEILETTKDMNNKGRQK